MLESKNIGALELGIQAAIDLLDAKRRDCEATENWPKDLDVVQAYSGCASYLQKKLDELKKSKEASDAAR